MLFFLKNWINVWDHFSGQDSDIAGFSDVLEDRPHLSLHRMLYERLREARERAFVAANDNSSQDVCGPFSKVRVGGVVRSFSRDESVREKEEQAIRRMMDRKRDDFLDGFFVHVKGRTKFPMVFINLRQKEKNVDQSVVISYLLPIENALCCGTVRDYRMQAGLMNGWTLSEDRSPYSGLSVVGIAEGAEVDLAIGINSPQEFPRYVRGKGTLTKEPILGDAGVLSKEYLAPIIKAQGYSGLAEEFSGGRVQMLAGYVEDYVALDLGHLYMPGEKRLPDDRDVGYLLDEKLDRSRLDILQRLSDKSLGVLSKEDLEGCKKRGLLGRVIRSGKEEV